jgi:hypothetical protein
MKRKNLMLAVYSLTVFAALATGTSGTDAKKACKGKTGNDLSRCCVDKCSDNTSNTARVNCQNTCAGKDQG